MDLPIEFTTTIKVEKLTTFYRKQRTPALAAFASMLIVAVALLVFLGQGKIFGNISMLAILIPVVTIGLIWIGLLYWLSGAAVKKMMENTPGIKSIRAFSFTLDSISHFSEFSNGELSWALVSAAKMDDNLITLDLVSGGHYLIDPDDLTAEQREDFRALLVEKGFI